MVTPPPTDEPPIGPGVTSVALGAVGLLLLFLPVLSIPLGILGLAFGAVGLILGLVAGKAALRWAVGGLLLSGLALGLAIAIVYAPADLLPARNATAEIPGVPEPHYAPPPARP